MPSTNTNLFSFKNKSLIGFSLRQYLLVLSDIGEQVAFIDNNPDPSPFFENIVYTWPRLNIRPPSYFKGATPLYKTIYLAYDAKTKTFFLLVGEMLPDNNRPSYHAEEHHKICSGLYLPIDYAFALGNKLHLQLETKLKKTPKYKDICSGILRLGCAVGLPF